MIRGPANPKSGGARRKAIPTKLVLRIKLKSDGTVEKYKVRCTFH
jgi:hypothetical protein